MDEEGGEGEMAVDHLRWRRNNAGVGSIGSERTQTAQAGGGGKAKRDT